MGPESALRTLHKALSLGADARVLVSDPSLAGADISLTAAALAAAIQRDSAPTSCCSASRPATPTATSWPPPSPSTCSARS